MPATLSLPRRNDAARRLVLRADTGETVDLDVDRWHAPASDEEETLLRDVQGPVVDLGCGPGRTLVALAHLGVTAIGIDSSPVAVELARRRRTVVLQQDVFDPLPGEGHWGTALLFDGTVGIGGDPVRLLARCRRLLSPTGRVVAEVAAPGVGWRALVTWFEGEGRPHSASFPWAVVGADAIGELASRAGLRLSALTQVGSGRWFATLSVPGT